MSERVFRTTTIPKSRSTPFEGLNPGVRRWIELEQTLNGHDYRDPRRGPVDVRGHTQDTRHRPESRGVWPQEVVWTPRRLSRSYGPVERNLEAAFGVSIPEGRLPLLLHPRAPAAHRRLRRRHGSLELDQVRVTPTSSHRSVLAWRPGRSPVILKLSLGAFVGGARRALSEREIVAGLMVSRLLDTIPLPARQRLGLDWFSESAGVVEAMSGFGWLLRDLPAPLKKRGPPRDLVPAFSLVAALEGAPSLLVEMITCSGETAETFVIERIVRPYVRALAYLLLEEGIHVEGHAQNVLYETDGRGALTGRLVLRDLSDMSVSLALRIAKGRPLPAPEAGFARGRARFPLATAAADHRVPRARAPIQRARDTVEHYGLGAFLACVNRSLAPFYDGYDAGAVEAAYLTLWQSATERHLGVLPLFRDRPKGLATDEAIAWFLRSVDWPSLGSRGGAPLPRSVEPLLIGPRVRRRPGRVFDRLASEWGDLYLKSGLAAFFRPAF